MREKFLREKWDHFFHTPNDVRLWIHLFLLTVDLGSLVSNVLDGDGVLSRFLAWSVLVRVIKA
jgi:hypothetical protein